MSDLRELYQEAILDHNKSPRNFGPLEDATNQADGFNPLCGDRIALRVRVENGKIEDIAFEGAGCAISTASASMMTEAVKGKSIAEAEQLFEQFHQMVTKEMPEEHLPELEELEALSGVREFPIRIKCATLAWHALDSALKGGDAVTTEASRE